MIKAVILIGGPQKGTRFRPLSLNISKPLFPIAGLPIIQHHIEACVAVPNLQEILLIGYYPSAELSGFVQNLSQEYSINIIYLQEFTALGTAGGMYHFRDQIRSGNPKHFFVINGDVCGDFPLTELLKTHCSREQALGSLVVTEATKQQSVQYGCVVQDKNTQEITHYVEKPSTFVSTLINCGVYVFSIEMFQTMGNAFNKKQQEYIMNSHNGSGVQTSILNLEKDILMPLAGSGTLYAYQTNNWWSQIKTAGSAIYANRHYLTLYRTNAPHRLANKDQANCTIIGDVYIHSSATIHPNAVLGPNVSIGQGATIGSGVRIRDALVLNESFIAEHCLIAHSIISSGTKVGAWSRIEGTPCDPNPDKPFAKMENLSLFNSDGRLNPTITILGCSVTVPAEVILLNSIVLPNKELTRSVKNEIVL